MEENAQAKVDALLRLFEQHGLEELILEEEEFKLHLRRGATPPTSAPAAPVALPLTAAVIPASAPEPGLVNIQRTVAVRSPLIGVFYRSSSPETPPFVEVGDVVREGQTVCIVEAMKVFNEIKSDWTGRVKDIPAKNGSLVQAGDPLMVLEFLEER